MDAVAEVERLTEVANLAGRGRLLRRRSRGWHDQDVGEQSQNHQDRGGREPSKHAAIIASMMQNAERIVYLIGAVVLGVGGVLFGTNLLPTRMVAEERGVFVPWLLTWVMIGATLLTGLVLAGFLLRAGDKR